MSESPKNSDYRIRTNQPSSFGAKHLLLRGLWGVVWSLLFRPSPRILHGWRRMLLRLFGARIAPGAKIYPSAKVWAPWNLSMEKGAVIGPDVDCYCVAPISIGEQSTVSQYSYLCAATHDFEHPDFPLVAKAIVIENQVWVAADVFVGPGVRIGEGAVVGARSTVASDLPPWQVCVGSPARPRRERIIKSPEKSVSS
jgi:putative colanic acid biosynthesis acetyltransferase WcaF